MVLCYLYQRRQKEDRQGDGRMAEIEDNRF